MRRHPSLALLVLVCSGAADKLGAAEWAVKGNLAQQLVYNDNIGFTSLRKEAVVGYILTPTLRAVRKTEVSDTTLQGQGDIRRYDDSRWDCDNYRVNFNNVYQTKRYGLSLNADYAVSCSYTQQLTDTGLLLPNNQTESYRLSPAWSWQISARDQLLLNATYSKTHYGNSTHVINPQTALFSGNETYTVNVGTRHEWDRRLSLFGKLVFSNIQYLSTNTSTQNLYGFQLGADYKINRAWNASVSGGPLWVEFRQAVSDASAGQLHTGTLGSTANVSINYTDKLSKFSTGYNNAINPSAIGQTLQTHSLFINYSYRVFRDLLLDASGTFISSKALDNSSNHFKRDYFIASAGIIWEFARDWQLKASYIYSWQNYQQDPTIQNLNTGTSASNAVMLSVNYVWDGVRTSDPLPKIK